MSHVLLDGTTQYHIYRMLDPSSPIVALEPERIQSIHEKLTAGKCFPGTGWFPRTIKMENNEKYDWLMASKAALRAISINDGDFFNVNEGKTISE